MRDLALVHLVRRSNGPAPLQRFLASYKAHAAEVDHELVLLCKGFAGARLSDDHADLLGGIRHRLLFVPDRGFDIGPYFAAARRYDEFRHFCFLNSFSRVLTDGWLALIVRHAGGRGVGLVGATGSYQSFAAPTDRTFRQRLRHVADAGSASLMAQRAAAWLLGAAGLWRPARHFPSFPNYHLRTNGFLASRELLLRLRLPPLPFKLSAFMLESGRDGLTAQVLAMGLRALLVDRRGEAFEKEEWHRANAFRQSRQEDLLIADNQTDAYERATPPQRALLCRLAWGPHARAC